jgi:hypothetical protein
MIIKVASFQDSLTGLLAMFTSNSEQLRDLAASKLEHMAKLADEALANEKFKQFQRDLYPQLNEEEAAA